MLSMGKKITSGTKSNKWYVEFNDGDSYRYTTKELRGFFKNNSPQHLMEYKVNDVVKILREGYYPFLYGDMCSLCKSKEELFLTDDTTYCRKHYIKILEKRLAFAKKQIDSETLLKALPKNTNKAIK